MSQERVIRIYVKPAIRKFLIARLHDTDRLAYDADSRKLFLELERHLCGRRLVGIVNDFKPTERGKAWLDLRVIPHPDRPPDMSHYRHRYLTGPLTRMYQREMFHFLDWLVRCGKEYRAAIRAWQQSLSLSDDEHALTTIERLYWKHRHR